MPDGSTLQPLHGLAKLLPTGGVLLVSSVALADRLDAAAIPDRSAVAGRAIGYDLSPLAGRLVLADSEELARAALAAGADVVGVVDQSVLAGALDRGATGDELLRFMIAQVEPVTITEEFSADAARSSAVATVDEAPPPPPTVPAPRRAAQPTRFVPTAAIRTAIRGREMDILSAVGIEWTGSRTHIDCPYPDHGGKDDWRFDTDKARAFCTCIGKRPGEKGAHSVLDVVAVKLGIDFEAAKVYAAEALGRTDLIKTSEGDQQERQATDAASLLSAPAVNRDDILPLRYLAFRLGVDLEEVPRPSTPIVGIRSLAYFDPPAKRGAKPKLIGHHPCAVFGTTDARGRTHAHRIYLEPQGAGKAQLGTGPNGHARDPKKSARAIGDDNTAGRCVLWGEPTRAATFIVAEGIETAAAVAFALRQELEAGTVAIAAAIAAVGLEALEPWAGTARVIVAADRDEAPKRGKPPSRRGERAARTLACSLHGRVPVSIALPGMPGEAVDWLDILRRDGAAAVRAVLTDANVIEPTAEELAEFRGRRADQEHAAALPEIWPRELGFVGTTAAAWAALIAANRPERYFRFAGTLCRIVRDEHGVTVADPLDKTRARAELARAARWLKFEDGRPTDIAPPLQSVEDVLATAEPPLPILAGIVNSPSFAADGSLTVEPGYHAPSRLLYLPEPGFTVPQVPARPRPADIAEARRLILDEVLTDFPFDGPNDGAAERAHAVALIIQASARQLIDGATPIYLIDKPTPGSGAGLLVDVVSIIATGHPATATTEARDDDEMRKKLTSFLMAGKAVFFLDNVNLRVDSGALASAVTAKFWEDRILGESRVIRVPVRNAWIIAGNNVRTSNEISRRCIRVRLDPRTDRPEERSGFRHANLVGWVQENRARLVWACLTLVRAWIAAGRPEHARTLGSFESWCRTMGGILDVAGIPGFLGNLQDARDRADEESASLRAFLTAWWCERTTAVTSAADLFPIAQQVEPLLPLGDGNERSQRSKFGRLLTRLRDRQFRIEPTAGREVQVRVEPAGTFRNAAQWRLREADVNFSAPSKSSQRSSHEISLTGQATVNFDNFVNFSPTPARENEQTHQHHEGENTHDHARAYARGDEKSSQSYQSSQNLGFPTGSGCELLCELLDGTPRSSQPLDGTRFEEIEL